MPIGIAGSLDYGFPAAGFENMNEKATAIR